VYFPRCKLRTIQLITYCPATRKIRLCWSNFWWWFYPDVSYYYQFCRHTVHWLLCSWWIFWVYFRWALSWCSFVALMRVVFCIPYLFGTLQPVYFVVLLSAQRSHKYCGGLQLVPNFLFFSPFRDKNLRLNSQKFYLHVWTRCSAPKGVGPG
jgi:hypothetical protein